MGLGFVSEKKIFKEELGQNLDEDEMHEIAASAFENTTSRLSKEQKKT